MSEHSAIQVFTGMFDAAQYGVGLQRGYDPNRKEPTTELEAVVKRQLKEANRREHQRTDSVSLFDILLQNTNELLLENDTLLVEFPTEEAASHFAGNLQSAFSEEDRRDLQVDDRLLTISGFTEKKNRYHSRNVTKADFDPQIEASRVMQSFLPFFTDLNRIRQIEAGYYKRSTRETLMQACKNPEEKTKLGENFTSFVNDHLKAHRALTRYLNSVYISSANQQNKPYNIRLQEAEAALLEITSLFKARTKEQLKNLNQNTHGKIPEIEDGDWEKMFVVPVAAELSAVSSLHTFYSGDSAVQEYQISFSTHEQDLNEGIDFIVSVTRTDGTKQRIYYGAKKHNILKGTIKTVGGGVYTLPDDFRETFLLVYNPAGQEDVTFKTLSQPNTEETINFDFFRENYLQPISAEDSARKLEVSVKKRKSKDAKDGYQSMVGFIVVLHPANT